MIYNDKIYMNIESNDHFKYYKINNIDYYIKKCIEQDLNYDNAKEYHLILYINMSDNSLMILLEYYDKIYEKINIDNKYYIDIYDYNIKNYINSD